jgi:non-lysosomal glucosylceramidase
MDREELHAAGIPQEAWIWGMTEEPPDAVRPAHAHCQDGGHWQGMPLGGMGAGGMGRNYRGSFGRWTVKAGCLKHFCEPANMFAVRQRPVGGEARAVALHPGYPTAQPGMEAGKALSSWDWSYDGSDASYAALFPKAWHHYPASEDLPVAMTCEQFSPILPGNYQESSYPVASFVWHLHNPSAQAVEVSVLFSFVNMNGWFADFGRGKPSRVNDGNHNHACRLPLAAGRELRGVVLGRRGRIRRPVEGVGEFCVAAQQSERCQVSVHTAFDPRGNGAAVWEPFASTGHLSNDDVSPVCVPQQEIAGAVCAKVTLAPGEKLDVPFALSWDLPVIEFGSGRLHRRRYTKFLGASGTHAVELAASALREWSSWSAGIDAWQQGVIGRWDAPAWYYTMLFNEAYLLVDGLTIWTDGTCDAPGEDPFFGIIECPDYPFYCTLDLWVYGSFVLLMFWPELEKNVIRRFADVILQDNRWLRRPPRSGEIHPANVAGAAPHDFGEPAGDPPFSPNSYLHQNSDHWKDLNCQFMLALCRDVLFLKDEALVQDTWPAAQAAIEYLAGFDADGDGLIENDGTPDQTMDNIPMRGPSAYCGGLWVAALRAGSILAAQAGDAEIAARWGNQATRAAEAFDRHLWAGDRYLLDTDGPFREAVFIDALFGLWYGHVCGFGALVPEERLRACLRVTYTGNVAGFEDGQYGGRNILTQTESDDDSPESLYATKGCQVEEILSGLNMSFAGHLLAYGLREEGLAVLKSLQDVIYRRYGLWFRTPAAWTADGRFRAILNLRPLVIWGVEFQEGGWTDSLKGAEE